MKGAAKETSPPPSLPPLPSLSGQRTLVTGAANGIGRGIAETLATLGARVVALDKDAQALSDAFQRDESIRLLAADIASSDAQTLADRVCRAAGGTIRLVVNNIGNATDKRFLDLTAQDFDYVMATNLRAPWFLTQELVRRLIHNRETGAVVFISSLHAEFVRKQPDYSSSKAATRMLVREMAAELAGHGIRVNLVTPGVVESASVVVDEAEAERVARFVPLGRIGRPDDVARIVAAVLSEEFGNYVTGANFVVDGGLALHSWALD